MKAFTSVRFWICAILLTPFLLQAQLPAPALLSPSDNASVQTSTVVIVWQAVPGANQYKVSVSTPNHSNDVAWDSTYSGGTTYTLPNLPNGTYLWRIRSKHADPYQIGTWSQTFTFTVNAPGGNGLAAPVLVSPANGSSFQTLNTNLSWQAVTGATFYKVKVATDAAMSNIVFTNNNVTSTNQAVQNLINNTTYYWCVQAANATAQGPFSSTFNFTVGSSIPSGLAAPAVVSPSTGSVFQVLGANLTWLPVPGATFYKVNIATDAAMANIIFTDNNVIATNRVAQNLNYNTTYYWSVQAANASAQSPLSKITNFTTMPDNPNAVTTHPRLLFTQADLPRLQGWASASNPIYAAMQTALASAIGAYNNQFFPGGQPNPNWPDNGGTTWSGYITESYAEFFAFWSLIDPNVANRPVHAQRARNLLMYVMNQAALGHAAGVPFRDPTFMTYDRSRVYGEACPLTVDWIYNAKNAANQDILTASDKATIRGVFMSWCNDQLTAYNHPTPIGLANDKQITLTNRWILNNYYSGHARNMTLWSLCIDAADDAPVNPNLHFSALNNSLRSYIYNATGAWLFQQYAQFEQPQIVAADYGIPATGLGFGSGGLSVEGSLYGQSIGWVAQELLALKTAGWADETVIGKQARLLTSAYWTRLMDGLLHNVAPGPKTFPQAAYLGPVYPSANYGDLLRTWITPELLDVTAPIGLIDMINNNNQTRLDKSRWFSRNVLQGGAAALTSRASNIWPNCNATEGIYYFLLLDPLNSTPADPRPAMPVTFHDPAFHRILARTDWTTNATWFDWQCHWTMINHQSGDGNQFELFRKGEWLIKERSGYTNDGVGYTSEFHNTLGLENNIPGNLQWFEGPTSQRGGQWTNGQNAGDPSVVTSLGNSFIYATGDATNLYNRPNKYSAANDASDILHASRSIVWLKPDHVVIYDRAQSKTANRFKRFFLQFTAPAVVSGKNAVVGSPGGQSLYLSNLLPAASVLTPSASEMLNSLAQLEPTTSELKIEDPSNPSNVRFLNVVQAADGGAAKSTTLLVQSSAGTSFDGVVVVNEAVMFPIVWGGPFSSTTYTIPASVTLQIVTGLTANAGYDVATTTNGGAMTVTITPGAQLTTDAGGVLLIGLNAAARRPNKTESVVFSLKSYPNPFTDNTLVQYTLPEDNTVTLKVVDLLGQTVAVLAENQQQGAGEHQMVFQANRLPTGIYLCKLSAGAYNTTIRLMVTH